MNRADLSTYLADFSALPRATQLVRESGLRTLLLHLHASEEMAEHSVKGPITVQCLQGSVSFRVPEETIELTSGSLISLPGGVPHGLVAHAEALLLVTICEQPG